MGTQKKTVSMRGFFEHPKQMFKLMDKKIIAILRLIFWLNCPYEYTFQIVTDKGADQTEQINMLVCAYVVHI